MTPPARLPQTEPQSPLRVIKEVPLTWIMSGLLIIVGQAGAVYYAQQRQGEAIERQSIAIEKLVAQVQALSTELGGKNLKDVEHDLRIADHERRMLQIESTLKGRP